MGGQKWELLKSPGAGCGALTASVSLQPGRNTTSAHPNMDS
jgi:hypothetical protein